MTVLLPLGAPVVRQSIFGTWLVDDGSLVPQPASGKRAAYAEAAARTPLSAPAAGPHRRGGFAPGTGATSPGGVPGALATFRGREGVGVSLLVGGDTPTGVPAG